MKKPARGKLVPGLARAGPTLALAGTSARAEDIDLFLKNPLTDAARPNLLLIVDNAANNNSNITPLPNGSGSSKLDVIKDVLGILTQPLAFFLFLTAGIAATKRIPFDTPEGESEIIGYFVEYSGMKFGMFAMADFLETVVIAGITTALFLGGWQVPYLQATGFVFPWGASVALPHLAVVGLQVGSFLFKVVVLIWFLMLIRWTLPRFRYDQAMRLGWLGLFPLSILNIVLTAIVLLALGR